MNLGDVLRQLGDGPLKDHTWTQSILSNLNSILPNSTALTPDNTGRDALKALVMLPEPERDQLLASEVDLLNGTLTLTQTTVQPAKKEEAKSVEFHDLIVKEMVEHPRSALTLVLGLVISLCVVVLVITMTLNYTRQGKAPDTNFLQALIKMLIDLFTNISSAPSSS